MAGKKDSPRIELDQDLVEQRTEWRVERVGWVAMAAVIFLALAGLLGRGGPLSSGEVSSPDARLHMRYERFTRHGAPSQMRVEFDHARSEDDTLATVWFDREFLDGVQIQSIEPEPVESETDGERLLFAFRRDESSERVAVAFDIIPEQIGVRSGIVGAGGSPGARFRQIVYP